MIEKSVMLILPSFLISTYGLLNGPFVPQNESIIEKSIIFILPSQLRSANFRLVNKHFFGVMIGAVFTTAAVFTFEGAL